MEAGGRAGRGGRSNGSGGKVERGGGYGGGVVGGGGGVDKGEGGRWETPPLKKRTELNPTGKGAL